MKKLISFLALVAIVISFAPVQIFANTNSVLIIDGNRDTICNTTFTGTKGMDSIINTASKCGFTYTLGWGDNFLDTINGVGWDGTNYWVLYVDNVYANKGVNDYNLSDVDEILWAYSDGSKTSEWFTRSAGSTAGEGIVGLINPSTGGMVDSDGDGIADVDEYRHGTDHTTPDKSNNNSSLAGAFASIIYLDTDGDGVSDIAERKLGTDPFTEDQTEESRLKIALKKVKLQVNKLIDLFAQL